MSRAVYRGCSYNTENVKKEYISWYQETHSESHSQNTYRGISYKPCDNVEVRK